MTATEVFGNDGQATVSTGGTTAPVAGTTETWTTTGATGIWPTADPTATPPAVFHIADVAPGVTTEKILVTDSRTSSWAVTRGADGSTPIAHAAGFTIRQIVSKGWWNGVPQTVNGHAGPVVTLAASDVAAVPTSDLPLSLANGGTGQITQQAALDALAGAVTSGDYLRGNGTHVQLAAIQAGDVPTLNQSTTGNAATATNLAGGATLPAYLAPAVSALTDGASIAVNAALGNVFTVTLGGNRTLANPSNPVAGQTIHVHVTQDGTGSRTLAYGTAYDFGTAGSPTLTTTAGKMDILGFTYDANLSKWCFIGSGLGF